MGSPYRMIRAWAATTNVESFIPACRRSFFVQSPQEPILRVRRQATVSEHQLGLRDQAPCSSPIAAALEPLDHTPRASRDTYAGVLKILVAFVWSENALPALTRRQSLPPQAHHSPK